MPAESAADAAREADVVITMLPMGKHLIEAYSGDGRLAGGGAGRAACSSIARPWISRAPAPRTRRPAAAGMLSVDAPVSGGVGGATAGTLTFMIGAEDAAAKAAQPILAAMGKKIVHCGGAGAGQAAKICNNMILGISMIAVSEAFVLGEKLGLSHQALFDVASTSSGQCWSLTSYCPVPGPVPASPSNNAYKPGFAGALMLKDLKLSQEAAAGAGAADGARPSCGGDLRSLCRFRRRRLRISPA